MTLVRRTNRDFDALLNNFMGGDFFMNQSGLYCGNQSLPAVNIIESDEQYTIELAAAGLNKEDFNIEFNNGKLTVSAKEADKNSEVKFKQREFNYAGFSRSFVVPKQKIDDSAISAKYENGVLTVLLPKREEAKPKPVRNVKVA
ncbi:Hsp20/alpha crystallin family protein [Labilibacter sediminis]|nr:Hsp20/alpha crystallin family protein [Labilibacter sediminis]